MDNIKILMLADDFTGALDSGVKFSEMGIDTTVIPDIVEAGGVDLEEKTQVLVVNTATRHMSPDRAYRIVYSIAYRALKMKVPCIYKKTDSALRGNIGAELAAALDASGENVLSFLPAFPQMGRVTRGGIQFVEGVPVSESSLGKDPFNQVFSSRVSEVIRSQTQIKVEEAQAQRPSDHNVCSEKKIVVYDSETVEEMEEIALRLRRENNLKLLAGCGGFASILPQAMGLKGCEAERPKPDKNLFFL